MGLLLGLKGRFCQPRSERAQRAEAWVGSGCFLGPVGAVRELPAAGQVFSLHNPGRYDALAI